MKTVIAKNKKKLEAERKELTKRLEALSKSDKGKEANPAWIDFGQKTDENAAEVAEYADTVSLASSLKERLAQIDAALLAMRNGTYGLCSDCGKPIEKARLEAMPTATLCLASASKQKK